jgi:uncharacterized membrane protein
MGYLLLIAGVLLWAVPHLFKRLAPTRRAEMGDKGKGLVALLLWVSLGLMIWGYRNTDVVVLWQGPAFLTHVNNLLMVFAVYLFVASVMKTGVTRRIRHPQLTGFKTWALAHLLVKGTLGGVILFGGLLAWAVVTVILINRANRDWTRPAPATMQREALAVVITLVATFAIGWLHGWLGPRPWG